MISTILNVLLLAKLRLSLFYFRNGGDRILKSKKSQLIVSICIAIFTYILLIFFGENIIQSSKSESGFFSMIWQASYIVIALAAGYIFYINLNYTPKQGVKKVANNIEIPLEAGEKQYGSAAFLIDDEEIDKVFSHYYLDPNNQVYKYLMDMGESDNPEYQTPNYGENKIERIKETLKSNVIESGGAIVGMQKINNKEKIRYIDDDTHLIVVGATRSGKTRHFVLQTICTLGLAGESIIATDPKGELYDYTHLFLERLGYKVYVLDFKDPKLSMSYNPLQPIIDAVNKDNLDEAQNRTWDLVINLMGEQSSHTEKIWSNGEMSVLGACILSVIIEYKDRPKYQTLTNVYYFMSKMSKSIGGTTPLNMYFDSLDDTHPAKLMLSIADIAPDKMRGSFFTSALTTLRLFATKSIYAMTKESKIDLSKIGDEKSILYFILPDYKTVYYPIVTSIVSQLYETLVSKADQKGGRLKVRVNNVFDEFGNFTKIDDFAAKLTVFGGRGIRFMLFLQSFSQLYEKYGKDVAEIIKGNCENLIYLWTKDNNTRKDISDFLGTYTTRNYGISSSNRKFSTDSSSSANLMQRELLFANDLGKLERPDQLIISKNFPLILQSPGIESWYFNQMLGLGDKKHNIALRERRHNNREIYCNLEEAIEVDNVLCEHYINKVQALLDKIMKMM